MAFFDISLLRSDADFVARVTACASIEGKEPVGGIGGPNQWTTDNMWTIAAAPGFGDKYAAALLNQIPRPGQDQSVISDPDILSVVQPME